MLVQNCFDLVLFATSWDEGELKRAKTLINSNSDSGGDTGNVARTLLGPRNLGLYAKHVHTFLHSKTTQTITRSWRKSPPVFRKGADRVADWEGTQKLWRARLG